MDLFFFRGKLNGLILLLCCLMVGLLSVHAQQIESNVTVILEKLPLEKQEKLKDFSDDLEIYINEYDWTDEQLEELIPVEVQIYLSDKSVSYEDRYSGTFLITNGKDIQYYDRYWYFPFQQGDFLEHSEGVFHPLSGFIDFYVYLILAGEYDKYDKFLGTPFYDKAKQINDQAQFDSRFISGWRERDKFINYIFSEDFQLFREMKDYYYLGLSYLGEEDDTARKYCKQAVDMLDKILYENPDSKEAVQFIQAHHLDLIDIFRNDRSVMEQLIDIDPDREDTYREYMN